MLTLSRRAAFSEDDPRLTDASRVALENLVARNETETEGPLRLLVERSDGQKAELRLPGATLPLLVSLLTELSRGKEVAVVTTDAEISTQRAADFMNVSRPYLVKLVDQNKIPSRKVGVRRRVRLSDVLRYMEETGDTASTALDEMAAENQRLGLYP